MPRLSTIDNFVLRTILDTVSVPPDPEQPNYQGATMVFVLQGSAPTGWVKDTSDTDYTLRCVTGSVLSGGSSGFSSVMSPKSLIGSLEITGFVTSTTLVTSQMAVHSHPSPAAVTAAATTTLQSPAPSATGRAVTNTFSPGLMAPGSTTTTTAGGGSHTHPANPNNRTNPVTFATVDLTVKYVEAILATRT